MGWNQPYPGVRADDECFNSTPESYDDRPQVADPYVLHFMGMTPVARYRHMRAVAAAHGTAVLPDAHIER